MDPMAVHVLCTLLLLMIAPPVAPNTCPRTCSCPKPTEVHCTFRSLNAIPAAVPKNVQRLNLGFNSIKITDKSLAGLRKLELLMVHGNNIDSLPDGTFRDLMSLQMLKISFNNLKEIDRRTFQGLSSMTRLHLDNNKLEFIHPDAFQGLTSLRLLQLEGNQLQQLHPATFATFTLMNQFHISTLRHLYLSDNGLTVLPAKLVETMPQLENLYLHGNPWTCDCNMRWLHNWNKTNPGVLKCKKDRAHPSDQLCPMCASPKHLQKKELHAVDTMVCSSPVIRSLHRTSTPEDTESEVMTLETFRDPFGNISLGLSDEHGNEVDLDCSIGEPREITKINWEQVNKHMLNSNITLSVDLECPVDREKYERLWRLIAYYSSVPAHLQRGIMLSKEPHPTYVYRQDSEKDALYYTGVKANVMAQPEWLMQASADLQLNRLQSSAKTVKLLLSLDVSETVDLEQIARQRFNWVMIEYTNKTQTVFSAILGSLHQMHCNVQTSEQADILWMLPDGSEVKASHSSSDNRVSVSIDGRLDIKSVSHTDTGIYYCIAKVNRDLAVLPFYLTVQETSSPPPGEDALISPTDIFAGSPISLPCSASGSPDAEISWILPNKNIVSFRDKSPRAFVLSNGTLHIPQALLPDSGHYKCIAINQHGADALAAKITVVRRKVLMRPLRKLPAGPQSASGVNTQIKVLTDDVVEASGNGEVNQDVSPINRPDPVRRIPAGLPPVRRGSHPSRNTWRRPAVPRKPTGSNVEERKPISDTRRRINLSRKQIDREKWGVIFAKIRDRNAQNTATPPSVQLTTESKLTEQTTQTKETIEGSSDGMTMQDNKSPDYLTTPHAQVAHTPMSANEHTTLAQGTSDTTARYNAQSTQAVTPNNQHTYPAHTAAEPNTTQAPSSVLHTRHDRILDAYRTSSGVITLPQTTSVPLHVVTVWQENTNSESNSTFSTPENHSTDTDVNEVAEADGSRASERSESIENPKVFASANSDKELLLSGSQIIPSVSPSESERNQEENGKYFRGTATPQLNTLPKYQAAATTAALKPAAQLPPRLKYPNFRRRNGGRRKNSNRRKQTLNETPKFMATTSANVSSERVRTTASSKLKIEPLEVTTAKFNTTIPFTRSQAASSGRLSHKENTVSTHNDQPVIEPPSLPTSPPKTKGSIQRTARPPVKIPSVTPLFPTATPTEGSGKMSSQAALGISETTSLPWRFDWFTSPSLAQQIFTGSTSPPVVPLLETQGTRVTGVLSESVPFSDNSFWSLQSTTVQTDVTLNQSNHLYTPTEKDTLATASPVSSIQDKISMSTAYTSPGLVTTPSLLFEDVWEIDQVTTQNPKEPGSFYSPSPNQTTTHDSKTDQHLEETTSIITVDSPATSTLIAPTLSGTSTRPDTVIPSTDMSHVTLPSAGTEEDFSLISTTLKPPTISVNISSQEQIRDIITPSDIQPASQSPDHKLTSPASEINHTITHQPTTNPVITTIQTNLSTGRLLTSPQYVTTVHTLPGPGFIRPEKPRITHTNSQTFTVKAETDAQLPCEATGEPKPFLSWTIVASGESIAQNTRVHRFEVHPNGTLIIKNTQHTDGGRYLCTVQNQHGADKKAFDLVVLPQHPWVFQPHNREIRVHLGEKVDLDCQMGDHQVPRVTWVLPNHIRMIAGLTGVSLQQRVAVLSNGTLRISQATYTDSGIYKCVDSNAFGTDTISVRLHVSASIPVIQQKINESMTLAEGTTAYIHCSATGVPQPVIRWKTPSGVQLTASKLFITQNLGVFPNGTLYIRRFGPVHSGRYQCTASNAFTSSRRTVMLTTRKNLSTIKASITSSSPKNTNVIYGSMLLLNCVATGQPKPWIIWKTPSRKLADAQYSFDPRIKVFPNGSLSIHSVTEKDSGEYLCVARNKMGDDFVLLGVNVKTMAAKIEQKQQRSRQEVVYGGDLKVDCVASGLPNPEISWALPDGTMINPVKQTERVGGGRSRRYLVFDNGTLFMNDVGMPEEGDYTCYAENQLGKDEMKVRVKVKAAMYPPKIQDKVHKIIKVFYGETSTLTCKAKGEPRPTITWISPTNRAIFPALEKYQVLDDGTLVVQKIQRFDGGNYTCMARNSAGQDHKIIRLDVIVMPPKINGLKETSSTKMTAVQGQRKLLDCVAEGTPTPRIMWVLPGNVILPAPYYSNRMAVHRNGTLEIRSTKRTDTGQLSCIARNEGGEVRLVVNLNVKEGADRPKIQGVRTESLSLTVGKAMTLNCSFEGSSQTHITWILPNGTPLRSGARFLKFFHRPDGSLAINNPSVGEAGTYRCLGRNSGGLVERMVTLSPGRKPEITNRYNSPVNIMNGEQLLLHCLTNGDSVRLTWTLPSGVVLNRPQRAGRYSVLPNGTLAIQQTTVYDRGSYQCRAANEYGSSVLSVSATVIAYPPRITKGPPSVTYTRRGVAVQLNCVASGIPKVEVAWETPDKTRLAVSAQPRLFGNKYVHPQGSLIIQNPMQRDAGTYRCTARNAIGIDSRATFLNVF